MKPGYRPVTPDPALKDAASRIHTRAYNRRFLVLDLTLLAPLLIATAALLAMVSLRNSDVATRARNCRQEELYKVRELKDQPDLQSARQKSLRLQIEEFRERYRQSSWAFISLLIALALFGFSGGLKLIIENDPGRRVVSGLLLFGGLAFFVVGLVMTVREFYVGPRTLDLDINGTAASQDGP